MADQSISNETIEEIRKRLNVHKKGLYHHVEYPEAADHVETLLAKVDELENALKRLASSEAFDAARSIDKERDAELIMRMEYAENALKEKGPAVDP